ncbi:MAG: hypothetical protein V1831_00295 [Candidatus Woesearchaeota archaeon]
MAKTKVLKKEWYPILAPKIFHNAVLGETCVYEPNDMIGKSITQNLMSLTNDVKRQNINIDFEINSVQNNKAFTNIAGYHMVQSSIKRLVRRNIEKIDMSFSCKTLDNKHLRVKPLLITRSATTGSVAAKIRKNALDFLVKYISSVSYDNLINDMVSYKLQMALKKVLSIVYPLRVCEIRSMEVVDLEKKEQANRKKEEKRARKSEKSEGTKSKKEAKPAEKEVKAQEINETEKKEEKVQESKDEPQKVGKTEPKV